MAFSHKPHSLQRPQGTLDLLPEGAPKVELLTSARAHAHVTSLAAEVLERAGAQLTVTPMFEELDVVQRGVGQTSDIVRKEMFRVTYFGEHGGYVLRPEGTAPLARAYLENGLKQLPSPLRLWTHGAMFRAERNQRGRYRQFHQVGYEVIGGAEAVLDAEAIALMLQVYAGLGLGDVRLQLGSVGDPADREGYNAYLRDLFSRLEARLSPDSRERLGRNPMRLLDSKDAGDRALLRELRPRPMLDFLGEAAAAHFAAVQGYLHAWDVPFALDPTIVRGLDYYNRTAWEVHHAGVGAQSALGGGGRYDGLIEQLGGPPTPAVGWAFGVERALLALAQEGVELPAAAPPLLFVAALDEDLIAEAARLALAAREVGRAEFAVRARKPGPALQEAARRGARYVALLGTQEVEGGSVTLRHLASGQQYNVARADLVDFLAGHVLDQASVVPENAQ